MSPVERFDMVQTLFLGHLIGPEGFARVLGIEPTPDVREALEAARERHDELVAEEMVES